MGRAILKVGDDQYLEWSTVADAPRTFIMTRDELLNFYREEYGREGLQQLELELPEIDRVGTAATGYQDVEDYVACNRAGLDETELTLEQIRESYRNEETYKQRPRGIDPYADESEA